MFLRNVGETQKGDGEAQRTEAAEGASRAAGASRKFVIATDRVTCGQR